MRDIGPTAALDIHAARLNIEPSRSENMLPEQAKRLRREEFGAPGGACTLG